MTRWPLTTDRRYQLQRPLAEHGLFSLQVAYERVRQSWGSGRTQTALGAVGTLRGIGAALATTLGGVLALSIGWRTGFIGLTVPTVLALALAVRLVAARPARVPAAE